MPERPACGVRELSGFSFLGPAFKIQYGGFPKIGDPMDPNIVP